MGDNWCKILTKLLADFCPRYNFQGYILHTFHDSMKQSVSLRGFGSWGAQILELFPSRTKLLRKHIFETIFFEAINLELHYKNTLLIELERQQNHCKK